MITGTVLCVQYFGSQDEKDRHQPYDNSSLLKIIVNSVAGYYYFKCVLIETDTKNERKNNEEEVRFFKVVQIF